MDKNSDKFIHSKKFVIILIVIFMLITLLLGTYAWFTWSSTDNTIFSMTIGEIIDVTFTDGNAIDGELAPVFNYYDGLSTSFGVNNKGALGVGFSIDFNISTIDPALVDNSGDINYAVLKGDEIIFEGDLTGADNNTSITLYNGYLDSGNTTYVIYLYIDGNVENDLSMMGKSIVGNIMVNASTLFTDYINALYLNADKTEVSNNSINYSYASSVSLMNDGFSHGIQDMWEELGFPFTDTAGCLEFLSYDNLKSLGRCTDDTSCDLIISSTLQNLALPSVEAACESSIMNGNVRYYGKNPNNYIDIGDVYITETVIDNFEKNSLVFRFLSVSSEGAVSVTTPQECSSTFNCSNYSALGYESEEACANELILMFGSSDTNDICGTTTKAAGEPKLYRIIGLFKDIELSDGTKKDLVKVVRDDNIGVYAWDATLDGETLTSSNDWGNSSLKEILNSAYYNSNSITHSYYDLVDLFGSNKATIITPTNNFVSGGINDLIKNRIETVKWNLGGWNDAQVYANQMYLYERGDVKCDDCTYDTLWSGKIALMYPSDFGYAVDFNNCSDYLGNYENCGDYNWLFRVNNLWEWTLTPYSSASEGAFSVALGSLGGVDIGSLGGTVRPTFYLDSELNMIAGVGTKNNPYVVE